MDGHEVVGFFRAFFHLVLGMFLAIFVPITSLLRGFENHARPNDEFWSVLYFLLLPGAGIGLSATCLRDGTLEAVCATHFLYGARVLHTRRDRNALKTLLPG